MSEASVETTAPAEGNEQQAPEAEQPKTFTEDYVKELRAEAAKYRTQAKQLSTEIETVRKSSMSDAEKAVAEAEARGRNSAVTEFGQRLARTEFLAEAARRNPGYDAAAVLDDLNLARYIGEDGEPDSKAIAAAVGRLVPEGSATPPAPPSFDGGTRQPAAVGSSMTDLIRKATGRA